MVAVTEASSNGGGPAVKVISQAPQLVKDAAGQYVPGRHITAQVVGGSTFVVDVPDAQYTVDNVKALLAAEAAKVDAVDRIGS